MTLISNSFSRRTFCLLALFLSFAGNLYAAEGTPALAEKEVREFENKLTQAFLSNDASKMRDFLSDDFINIFPNGKRSTADEMLAPIKKGEVSFAEYRLDDLKVRIYGNTAIITCVIRGKIRVNGEDLDVNSATTDVVVRGPHGLKVVSSHSSSGDGQKQKSAATN